jgi:serine protease Do
MTLALALLLSQEVSDEDLTTTLESVYTAAAEKAGPAIVSVFVDREKEEKKTGGGGLGSLMDGGVFKNRPAASPVSGVVVDPDGWIVTSHFNVSGKVKSIQVTLADGRKFEALLKGFNATYDVAVLKVEATGLKALKKAPLNGIRTGQMVIALGRAPDTKNLTLNQGIVSAPWRMSGRGIQLDARCNYGNAGGAVVDRDGRLIGITAKIDTKYSGSYGQNSGVAFAVTWDKLDEILPDLKAGKTVSESKQPFLGIQANVEAEVEGVLIDTVQPASAAEKAGVKPGDIILEFDGKKVKNFDQLRAGILSKQPGDKVKMVLKRGEEVLTVEAELGWKPGD